MSDIFSGRLGLHVDLDAYRLERFLQTGHPRTIGILLGTRTIADCFQAVDVDRVTLNGEPIFPQPAPEVTQ